MQETIQRGFERKRVGYDGVDRARDVPIVAEESWMTISRKSPRDQENGELTLNNVRRRAEFCTAH